VYSEPSPNLLWMRPDGLAGAGTPGDLHPGVARSAMEALGVSGPPLTVDEIPHGLPAGGGWIFVPPGVGGDGVGRALIQLAGSPDSWSLVLFDLDIPGLEETGVAGSVVPVSTGHMVSFGEFVERMQRGGARAAALGHRATLSELSRIRHDINNALTAALAETQFMQMDAPAEGELAEGLKVVESQIQRVRELTGELGAFRVRLR
jgi:hypothetical protein